MAILSKVIPQLVLHFEWGIEDPSKARELESMFGARWKDVRIFWKERSAV
jgi:hypothetical protein